MKVTLTERGQISIPAALRKQLHLKPGQHLQWEKISNDECRVRIVRPHRVKDVQLMRGYMKRFQKDHNLPKTTSAWMTLLRAGEQK